MALVNVSTTTTLFAPPPPTPPIELLEPFFGVDNDNGTGFANETVTSSSSPSSSLMTTPASRETTTTFVPYMGKDKLTKDEQMDATLLKSNEPNAPPTILPPPPMPPPPPPLCTGWTCNSRFHSVTGRGTSHHNLSLTHETESIHQILRTGFFTTPHAPTICPDIYIHVRAGRAKTRQQLSFSWNIHTQRYHALTRSYVLCVRVSSYLFDYESPPPICTPSSDILFSSCACACVRACNRVCLCLCLCVCVVVGGVVSHRSSGTKKNQQQQQQQQQQ